ncbi:succinylglutamate-semialdehyde dehydrogenase [Amphiplicatus metriothermophilus]|uniref:N-succinylglutamate 5-semialdehyde dehydrogenase n=1 Tax=Amphiplicatus metriothermophilus TaxID=1519374 RepID=A0A239PUU8_9PROT|nr:succinylglutamate-semialdehyde dehydrogenase [Amphiplicatus metriothermophilus]MBB5519504.1 succinylglutamic semialdehyde dehydrogenase [Amphiplicatus metriothermophilus]SNT74071.1 succinylglutamic semialdehyde dehydrogenase [Amphiplicatus metriothermophilus]
MTDTVFIDGKWRKGAGAPFRSLDPCTGETVFEGPAASREDVAEAVGAARRAFRGWALRPVEERIAIMERYRDIILEKADDLARLISRETGKPFWETKTEAASVAGKVDISIRAWRERTGVKETASGPTRGMLRHKPHGVLAVLGPFNFPAHLPNGHIVPALIAGNALVFKPSELAPGPGAFIVRAMVEAGVPDGVVNLVQGPRETGEALVDDERIDGLLFTGGARAGLSFHRAFAGRPEKILALELGGNNPLIWWDTEDVEAAAWTVVQSSFLSAGQRCTCARRLIVPDDARGKRYVDALAALADRLVIGAPFDEPQPFMGPVITAKAAEALERAFDALVEQGAEAIRTLSVQDEGAAFVSPGILDVADAEAVPDEEHFGPMLQVWRVKDFDAAVERANATRYGLAAGLLSDDAKKWETFFALSRAGIVNWNRQTTGASSAAPFGGIGRSGNHRPSAYYAADYCAYPVASMEGEALLGMPEGQVGVR